MKRQQISNFQCQKKLFILTIYLFIMQKKVILYFLLYILSNSELILISNSSIKPQKYHNYSCQLDYQIKYFQKLYSQLQTSTSVKKQSTKSTTPLPIIPTTVFFSVIDCQQAFSNLQKDRALYAYYFSKAAWAGAKICFFQNSYESPALLYIILKALQGSDISTIVKSYEGKISKQDIQKILVYTANFLQNTGSFKSFGDSKFIPQCSENIFVKFWRRTPYWCRNLKQFDQIWRSISQYIYGYENPLAVLQFSDKNGTSGYYSKSCTSNDAQKINKILLSKGIQSQNNRVVKVSESQFIVKIPAVDPIPDQLIIAQDGTRVNLKYGEFRPFVQKINYYLAQAQKYSANKNQQNTIGFFIDHFKTGDMKIYRESQKSWVKDQQPDVETNIGYIQTYQDPINVRAQYQGIVSIVNKKQSELLSKLVNAASTLLTYLPWGKNFEVQTFQKPDFTSLQVLAFASSDIPSGINLPNYDDIRQNLGFKNLNLGNNFVTPKQKNMKFYPKDVVQPFINRYRHAVFVVVALHQLLGHGSGRLLREKPTFLNPIDNSEIQTFYKGNQTWRSVFGSISSLYQQCRADSVALYLSLFPQIQQILLPNFTPEQREQIVYILWYSQVTAGIRGLEYYDVDSKKWKQAHIGGRFAIYNVMKRKGGVVEVKELQKDGKPYMQIVLNRETYKTLGKEAIADFLLHLQVYKSIADSKAGTDFINQFLQVDDQYLKYKKIVEQNKSPRRILIQPYLSLENGVPVYQGFNDTAEDCINSYVKNFREDTEQIIKEWRINNQQFKY